MPDWEERITKETAPAIRVEHELRYRLAAPLIAASSVWADLGCGHGIAAAEVIGGGFGGRVVLVDLDEEVVRGAAHELGGGASVEAVRADLSDRAALAAVRETITGAAPDGDGIVLTCFEVVEHLPAFAPLMELLLELAAADVATAILSVPNDAFFGTNNPHHRTTWGDGAFAELQSLLPERHTILHQLPLAGSALAAPGTPAVGGPGEITLETDRAIPSHFVVAIGPRCDALVHGCAVRGANLAAQRRWDREALSGNAVLQAGNDAMRAELEALIAERDELAAIVRERATEQTAWRAYIHELEARLGLPASGTPEREAHDAASALEAPALGPGTPVADAGP